MLWARGPSLGVVLVLATAWGGPLRHPGAPRATAAATAPSAPPGTAKPAGGLPDALHSPRPQRRWMMGSVAHAETHPAIDRVHGRVFLVDMGTGPHLGAAGVEEAREIGAGPRAGLMVHRRLERRLWGATNTPQRIADTFDPVTGTIRMRSLRGAECGVRARTKSGW